MHEQLLKHGVDFSAPKNTLIQTLKLEWFDDSTYEARLPMDYINLARGVGEPHKNIPEYFFGQDSMEERLPLTLVTSASTNTLKMLKTEESDDSMSKGIPALAITLDADETGTYRECLV